MHEEERQAREAARKILRVPALSGFSRLRHHGAGEIYVFSVRGRREKYFIKTYPGEWRVRVEAKNFYNIAPTSIHTPRYFGKHRDYLVEEFVEGKCFQEMLGKLSPVERRGKYRAAIEELVRIHTSGKHLKNKRWLNGVRFGAASFRKRLRLFQKVVADEGFSSYARHAGRVPRAWREAVAKLPVERLVRDLGVRGSNYVVGHGDYKPNNLIFKRGNERPWVVDWLGMSKAQPWYDLAYLLVHEPRREEFVRQYLTRMREKGFLRGITERKAEKLFLSGRIFQELQRAKSNAHRIHSSRDSHHISEFRAALDGLSKLVPSS